MSFLHSLFTNKAWVAHLLALGSLTGAELSQGQTNPYLLGAITFVTSVFHICDTLKQVKQTPLRVDMSPPTGLTGIASVDASAPPLTNAAGDAPIEG